MFTPIFQGNVYVRGGSTMRGLILPTPVHLVRELLPAGLELGEPQIQAGAGKYPVFLFFNDVFRLVWSIPTLDPSVTYHEFQIGIPYTYLSTGWPARGSSGPYYFMPRLCLDHIMPVLGGIFFWGFAKEMARIRVTQNTYTVTSLWGQEIAAYEWIRELFPKPFLPVSDFPFFEPVRQVLDQTIVSQLPAAMGPVFVLSDVHRDWDAGFLRLLGRPIRVEVGGLIGNSAGTSPYVVNSAAGLDQHGLGPFELRVPWRLSLPYPPPFAVGA
jgi:hypothetical protein